MKKVKLILAMTFSLVTISSCLVDDQPQQLENALANTSYTIGFNKEQHIVSYSPNTGIKTVEVLVDLISGENFSNTPEQIVSFEIDPSSTAVIGTVYEIENLNFSIEENRNFGKINISLLTDNLTSQSPGTIVLNLLSASNGVIAEQFKTTTIFICPDSDLSGNYTSDQIIANGAPNAVVTEIGPGEYQISAMPFIAFGGAGGDPAYINFTNVCGVLYWDSWVGGTLTEGTGYIAPDGSLVFNYLIIYNNNTADPNDIWFNLGSSTYTPN